MSKIYKRRSEAKAIPARPPPSPQCIKTGGFVLWPGGISPIDANLTDLNSSRKSVWGKKINLIFVLNFQKIKIQT